MAHQVLLVSAFLLFLNFSLVLCRGDYYQYFTNHTDHRNSTSQDGLSALGLTNYSDTDVKSFVERQGHPEHSYSSHDSYNNSLLNARIGIIVGAVSFILVALCVTICCRIVCCRGRRNPGFILRNNTAQLVTQPQQLGPQSPLMHTFAPAQQLPNYPTGYGLPPVQQQDYSPEQQQFQTAQVQQQYQYSPTQEQYHNPAMAPPPYSEKY